MRELIGRLVTIIGVIIWVIGMLAGAFGFPWLWGLLVIVGGGGLALCGFFIYTEKPLSVEEAKEYDRQAS